MHEEETKAHTHTKKTKWQHMDENDSKRNRENPRGYRDKGVAQ